MRSCCFWMVACCLSSCLRRACILVEVWLVMVEMDGGCGLWLSCLDLEGGKSGKSSDDVSTRMEVRVGLGLLRRGPRVRSTASSGLRPFMRTSK